MNETLRNDARKKRLSLTPSEIYEKSQMVTNKRISRKLGKRTRESLEIDPALLCCSSKGIEEMFGALLLDPLLAAEGRKCPLQCYQIVLNSLKSLHAKQHPESSQADQQTMVNALLKKFLYNDSNSQDDQQHQLMNSPKDVLRCELFILLELYLLRFFPIHLDQTRIVERLRAIYIVGDPVSFHHFLDDVVCDEFLDDLPFYLAGIYEQLSLTVPLDLQRFQSQEYRQANELKEDDQQQLFGSNKLSDRMELFIRSLEEVKDEKEEEKERMRTEEEEAKAKIENDELKTRAPKKPRKALNNNNEKEETQSLLARRRIHVVPDTPEKEQNEAGASKRMEEDELIEQTPIGKISAATSTGPSKLAQLLRQEEERLGQLRIQQEQLMINNNNNQQPKFPNKGAAKRGQQMVGTRARRALNVVIEVGQEGTSKVAADVVAEKATTSTTMTSNRARRPLNFVTTSGDSATKVAEVAATPTGRKRPPPTPSVASGGKLARRKGGRMFKAGSSRSSTASSSVVSFPFSSSRKS